ncbi:MAG: hypothetical protein ABF296_09375 [Oceanococcaceae bacterium]
MSYWIFRRDDGTVLAIHDTELGNVPINDDLGELIYDEPMPRIIARMHVVLSGGEVIGGAAIYRGDVFQEIMEMRNKRCGLAR